MDSPPCNFIKTKDRGRTSPELYSDPFDHRFLGLGLPDQWFDRSERVT